MANGPPDIISVIPTEARTAGNKDVQHLNVAVQISQQAKQGTEGHAELALVSNTCASFKSHAGIYIYIAVLHAINVDMHVQIWSTY